jgi:hypothetical protein
MRVASFQRMIRLALIAAAFPCLALAGFRIIANLSLRTPLQLVTSGAEQEALDSIWRRAHGLPVYTDPHAIPYTASCFNWLFYAVYGSVARAVLHGFHLDDAWLPTICRGFTLCLATVGAALFAITIRVLQVARSEARPFSQPEIVSWPISIALGILAFFNPLCGFWTITARPDIGAVLLELVGGAFFSRYLRHGGMGWIALAALALEGAWSFKQSALGALAGIVLTLVLPRRGRALGLLAAIWLGGVMAALLLGGPDYRQELYLGQIHSGFSAASALRHFGVALLKMPLIAVALVDWALAAKRCRADSILRATGLILISTLALDFAASSKVGAGDYYFLPAGVWSTLWLGLSFGRTGAAWANRVFSVALILIFIDAVAVLTGLTGRIDCRDARQPYEHLARYLAAQPGPVFVQDTYGDLPWISPTAPHFVVAFNDGPDRNAGVPFQRGGGQGLLAAGYFSTVVTEAGSDEINAALLARYRFVRAEAGWKYFERNGSRPDGPTSPESSRAAFR